MKATDMSLFSGAGAAPGTVEFKCGRMNHSPHEGGSFRVVGDVNKGKIVMSRKPDGIVHFEWCVVFVFFFAVHSSFPS